MKYALCFLLLAMLLFFSCKHELDVNNCRNKLMDGLKSDKICSSTPSPGPNEVFVVVEDLPFFPGCDSIANKAHRKECSDEKILEFIYENLQYPAEAINEMLEGSVVVQFVIETDGCVGQIEIVKDIGCGCGNEAMRIIEQMPFWQPGKQRGIPVRVLYNLPIRFEL